MSGSRRTRSRFFRRRGMTLYEIVLSLGILLGSMAVMANLVSTGSRAATQARLHTKATLLCQTKLAEIMAGAEPMVAAQRAALAGETTGWTWSLELAPAPHVDIVGLEVTVSYTGAEAADGVTSTLVRFVRDPVMYEEVAADAAAENNSEAASESASP